MNKLLALGDLQYKSESEILRHIAASYEATVGELKGVHLLIAYESVGNWGCDSSSYFLFKKAGNLFEVRGSHCSCYGFEGQWKSRGPVTKKELKSDKFYISTGGYDGNADANEAAVRAYIKQL